SEPFVLDTSLIQLCNSPRSSATKTTFGLARLKSFCLKCPSQDETVSKPASRIASTSGAIPVSNSPARGMILSLTDFANTVLIRFRSFVGNYSFNGETLPATHLLGHYPSFHCKFAFSLLAKNP